VFKDDIGCDLDFKKILICHVDNYIGSLNPYTGEIHYDVFDNFTEFVTELLHNNPQHSPHNVTDSDIVDRIRKKIQYDKLLSHRIQNENKY
jgi:hypothetical protein